MRGIFLKYRLGKEKVGDCELKTHSPILQSAKNVYAREFRAMKMKQDCN